MSLALNSEQSLIARTARDFVRQESPVARFRALRDRDDPLGYSPVLYAQMADLGWAGLLFDEAHGGAGLGFAEMIIIMEELGRSLAPEPFIGCVGLAGTALARSGAGATQEKWLRGVADGSRIVALAHHEPGGRHDVSDVGARADFRDGGFVLNGAKSLVLDACGADAFIVPARAADGPDGLTLFLVEANTPGLKVERQRLIDHRNCAMLELTDVPCPASNVIGEVHGGAGLLERSIEAATVLLSGEMLGGMSQAFDLTLHHMKTRVQFGVPIGSFQALKHRAARLFMDIELARSAVLAAARALDSHSDDASRLASLAKARCSDAYKLVANEAVQIHAGMGMTDACDIGLYLKRAQVSEAIFGDARHHRNRWARLSGY